MAGTRRRGVFGIREDEDRSICTSHVERNRFSKKFENLDAACNLHMAYYNFCWRPDKLRVSPAMAAGAVRSLWTFNDLMGGAGK